MKVLHAGSQDQYNSKIKLIITIFAKNIFESGTISFDNCNGYSYSGVYVNCSLEELLHISYKKPASYYCYEPLALCLHIG